MTDAPLTEQERAERKRLNVCHTGTGTPCMYLDGCKGRECARVSIAKLAERS